MPPVFTSTHVMAAGHRLRVTSTALVAKLLEQSRLWRS
jgi:hypothetical protein